MRCQNCGYDPSDRWAVCVSGTAVADFKDKSVAEHYGRLVNDHVDDRYNGPVTIEPMESTRRGPSRR